MFIDAKKPRPMTNSTMKLVDLFCGCGGFSLGAHNAGFCVSSAYDFDEVLTSSFPLNFPSTKLYHRDIASLTGVEVIDNVGGAVDGIFGGPPCQGFSSIGKQKGNDPRRKLLSDFFRIVSEVEPNFFVMENVRGLVNTKNLSELHNALELVSSNYHIMGPTLWDAAQFGAATKRQRVFVIGVKKSRSGPMDIGLIEKRMSPAVTVRDAIHDLSEAIMLHNQSETNEFDQWTLRSTSTESKYAIAMRAENKVVTSHLATVHRQDIVDRFAKVKPGQTDVIGRHPRLHWDGQCPTLRAGTGPDLGSYQSVRPIHPEQHRVITVREAARLQGFPDNHVFHKTVWHSFRMIGNSVSPIISEAIFSGIAEHFGVVPAKELYPTTAGVNLR